MALEKVGSKLWRGIKCKTLPLCYKMVAAMTLKRFAFYYDEMMHLMTDGEREKERERGD